jgi:DNA-binding response OmpR family regulator
LPIGNCKLQPKVYNFMEKKRILLVEDDSFVSDIYDVRLKQEGFEVIISPNGMEAIKSMGKNIPDLILLDVVMPYMDGIETLKKIKSKSEWKEIPVIMLTNLSEKDKVEEALNLGANDFMVKSHFTPSEVVDKIKILLNL